MSRLVVGGTIGIDTIRAPWGSADRVLGGSASYAATSAALLSNGVELIGAVGEDFPRVHTDALAAIGVGLEGLDVRQLNGVRLDRQELIFMFHKPVHQIQPIVRARS